VADVAFQFTVRVPDDDRPPRLRLMDEILAVWAAHRWQPITGGLYIVTITPVAE